MLITDTLEPLIFQSVALNAALADASLHNVVSLEDSVATVSESGLVFVSLMNLTSNPQRVRKGTRLGHVVPVSLVYQAIPQQTPDNPKTEVNNDHLSFVNRVYENMNYSTDSQLTSSSEFEFCLQLSQPKQVSRIVRYASARTRSLWLPYLGPESQLKEVPDLWGPAACTALENILTEFDDLFMKQKADIGR